MADTVTISKKEYLELKRKARAFEDELVSRKLDAIDDAISGGSRRLLGAGVALVLE